MVTKAMEALGEKMASSAELREKADQIYQQLAEDLAGAHDSYFGRVVELAKENGVEITPEEVYQDFQKGMDELGDKQLDAVVGGTFARIDSSPTLSSGRLGTSKIYQPRLPGIGKIAGT